MKKSVFLRKAAGAVVLIVCCLYTGGCGVTGNKPADEDLSLVLAGMDGSDHVSFEGAAGLLIGGRTVAESALYYGGKIEDHNKVSLHTLLPDSQEQPKTAGTADIQHFEQSHPAAPSYYTRLEKKDGAWAMLSSAPEEMESNPLPALNPLGQLEELEARKNQVTEESGAARGTKTLRIELTPAEARAQLTDELESRMQAIRPADAGLKTQEGESQPPEVTKALNGLWEQKNTELLQKLEQADIRSVYYLKVDTRYNRPKRLTWTRTVSYPGAQEADEETYVTKVDFYGYR
ncbi:hypothetical protein C2I18_23930 [Paenibacillus sp. PK3_47]|uniref:hypothetical protein n=1 Tax=Paenibacillus sp. PK3_47 TaxID=2072642 RepID=UPI00201DF20B|nr:hypothetical protein [Paenibacillus sp. PK3_47]UQZ36304.1 hypothetical protein C2I18_23930 [Paenibacillus sp. PK3_47]